MSQGMGKWVLCGGLAAALVLPVGARPQRPLEPASRPKGETPRDSRPPVPPGVPTTGDNAHWPTEAEVRLGRDGAAEVEKEYKVVTSGPDYERLMRIVRDVMPAVQRPEIAAEYRRVYSVPKPGDRARRVPFEYSVKLLDSSKVVNAFSLAGGPIYFTRGLLAYAPSDHEVAGVLAHEAAHVAFHHIEVAVRKSKKISSGQLWTLLGAVLAGAAGAPDAAAGLLMGSQYAGIAMMTGYGRELETEADRVGVLILRNSPYSPLGMVTFMQKLARDERLRGNPDYGIFNTHPYPNERVNALRAQLQQLGYPVDSGALRAVGGYFRVQSAPTTFNGKPAIELGLNGSPLFVVVAGQDGLDPAARAERIARQVEAMFAQNITFNDVRLSPDKLTVLIKGVPVIQVQPEDAAVLPKPGEVAERAFSAINRSLLSERL